MIKSNIIRRIPRNTRGRDFVVGDIHGSFDLVIDAMKAVSFNRNDDRIIAVGDLIDRGKSSHRCAKFLSQPYVFSVLGNHEDMLLDLYKEEYYDGGVPSEAILNFMCRRNGLEWWLETAPELRQEILAALRELPLVIEVETERGSVGFVHADVPTGLSWNEFKKRLEEGCSKTRETALWGRSRIKAENEDGVEGVGRVFVGHTPQWSGVKRFGNVYAVDTGAVYKDMGIGDEGYLSMINIVAQTECLTENKSDIVFLNVVDEEIWKGDMGSQTRTPFGQYARVACR